MPNSYTANLNLTLPEVGADTDAWGGHLNDGLTTLDGIFKSDGTGTSVGMKVGSGKTLAVAGTLTATGTVTATAATISVTAGNTSIKDGSDATKVLKLDASGITTGTTRTLTAPDASGTIALTSNTSFIPTGTVLPYAGSSAPSGYLLCDGSAVSRATYAALFAIVGTTYGAGNGSTTFNLPDLGGRVPAGKEASASRLTSAGSGVDGGTLGATGGAQTITLTAAEQASMPVTVTLSGTATGTVTSPTTLTNTSGQGALFGQSVVSGSQSLYGSSGTVSVDLSSGSGSGTATGSGGAHRNVQPTIVLNYIIRT